MKKLVTGLLFAAGVSVSALSSAGVIDGTIYRIDGDGNGEVNDLKVSRVLFTVTAGTSVFFDSLVKESTGVDLNGDGAITSFDNYMVLYSGNTALTWNDDSPNTYADGSVHYYDSTLEYTFTNAGTYMVTLGQLRYGFNDGLLGYEQYASFNGGNGPDWAAWRLTMTAQGGTISDVSEIGVTAVPEPASMALFGLGLLGLGAVRRARRA